MSVRLIVSCDSDPAPYAGGSDWPCRAWLVTRTDSPVSAHVEAAREGWTIELTITPAGVNEYRHTCPACARVYAALGGASA